MTDKKLSSTRLKGFALPPNQALRVRSLCVWVQDVRVSAGVNDLITNAVGRIELGVRA
jgi:hypothetical protein